MSAPSPTSLSGTATPYQVGPGMVTGSSTTPQPTQPVKKTQRERKKVHPCSWTGCDRLFSCQHNVEQHIREAHTFEKPHVCHICGAGFSRPYGLNRHLQVHGVQKPEGEGGRGRKRKRPETDAGQKSPALASSRDDTPMPNYSTGQQSFNANQPMVNAQPDSHPQPQAYAIDNFFLNPTTCAVCPEVLNNREDLLQHHHFEHGFPQSEYCDCEKCLGMFGKKKSSAFEGLNDQMMQQAPCDQFGDWVLSTTGMDDMMMVDDPFSAGDEVGMKPLKDYLADSYGTDVPATGSTTSDKAQSNRKNMPSTPDDSMISSAFTANMSGGTGYGRKSTPRSTVATSMAIPPGFTANIDAPTTGARTSPFASAEEYERFTQNIEAPTSGAPLLASRQASQSPKQYDESMLDAMDYSKAAPENAYDEFGDWALDPQLDQVKMAESEEILSRL